MESNAVLIDALGRVQTITKMAVEGLSVEQLTWRPTPNANTIAWLAWHLTRVQDNQIMAQAGRQQAWIEEGWHARFGKPADPADTGQRYTPEQVAAIRPESAQLLLDYHAAVYARSVAYLETVTPADLDREIDDPRWNPPPTLGVRLVSICADNLQHAGQAVYLRGCVQEAPAYPA